MKLIPHFILIISCYFIGSFTSFAQPQLPDIGVETQGGISILAWINPYKTGVKSVAVQRSHDSIGKFSTIGFVADTDKGVQNFIDGQPRVGTNWYRLVIEFSSGMEWTSNTAKIELDSTAVANRIALPSNDSVQKIISQMDENLVNMKVVEPIVMPQSRHVFTNPFTGNINIELDEVEKNNYSLFFYNGSEKEVLKIKRVNESTIILDKRNFQKQGLYKFKLYKNQEEFEIGYINIY